MNRMIDVRYCKNCGQLERVRCAWDLDKQTQIVEVGCDCGAGEVRITEMNMHELYALNVEVEKEEEPHDDPDPGDVQEG